jgi:epoxyqueuosine reductase
LSQEGRSPAALKELARARALALGFHAVGFAEARPLPDELERLERWLAAGHHAGMGFMERWTDVRVDPGHAGMVPGARTVVSVALACDRGPVAEGLARHLASFARGPDYHDVVRGLLGRLLAELRAEAPELRGRVLVDSAPLLERAWAVRAGLGWIGRNSCLINPELGSMLVLGELVLTAALEPDPASPEDRCGDCRACVEACPGAALVPPEGRVLDSRSCLAYWTVEARDPLPPRLEARSAMLFGCDACQTACPWNAPGPALATPLAPLRRWSGVSLDDVAAMDEARLAELLRGTSLSRAGAGAIRTRARRLLHLAALGSAGRCA